MTIRAGATDIAGLRSPRTTTMLTPDFLDRWRSQIATRFPELAFDVPPIELRGRDGLAKYSPQVRLSAQNPDAFGSCMYLRSFSIVGSYTAVLTPVLLERTPHLIQTQPDDKLIAGVTAMRGITSLTQGAREFIFRPGQLAFVSNGVPYEQRNYAISDLAGLVIPVEYLGKQRWAAEGCRHPVAPDTLLSRATSSFVRKFALESAMGGLGCSQDAELAAIDLVVACLAEVAEQDYRLQDNCLLVYEGTLELIERRHRDPEFSPDAAARELHMSRRQLYRVFEQSGQSLAGVIAERRIETARQLLLKDPRLPLGAVAHASGFTSVATLRNRFRAKYELGPAEYREQFAGPQFAI